MQKHFILLFSIAVFIFPYITSAQVQPSFVLMLNPATPEVGDTVTVSSQVQGANTPKASQSWFINGTESLAFKNKDTFTLTIPNEQTLVTSRVVFTDNTQLEKSTTINPTRVDLIVSADTLTPAFYKGRSLPTSGSPFTVSALVFKNNTQLQNGLSYAWKIGNKTYEGGALRGKSSITYTPNFESSVVVSVSIFDAQNTKIAEDTVEIPVVKPEILFYEHNPLRGLLQVALKEPHIFVGEEMTVRAEGYYLNAQTSREEMFTEWKIDGRETQSSSDDGQDLVIVKDGKTGKATLSFHIRNLTNLLQGVRENLTITF